MVTTSYFCLLATLFSSNGTSCKLRRIMWTSQLPYYGVKTVVRAALMAFYYPLYIYTKINLITFTIMREWNFVFVKSISVYFTLYGVGNFSFGEKQSINYRCLRVLSKYCIFTLFLKNENTRKRDYFGVCLKFPFSQCDIISAYQCWFEYRITLIKCICLKRFWRNFVFIEKVIFSAVN